MTKIDMLHKVIFAFAFLTSFVCLAEARPGASPDEKADVFVGTQGVGHVTPAAAFPFGMIQAGPDTSASPDRFVADWAHTCGYQHDDPWIWRFSQTHLSGTGVGAFGDFGLLPYVSGFQGDRKPARIVKESEKGEPGYYAVTIDEAGARIACEMIALRRVVCYRMAYPAGRSAKLLVDLDWGIGDPQTRGIWGRHVRSCMSSFPSATEMRGGHSMWIWNGYRFFFAAAFSRPMCDRRLVRAAGDGRGEVWELDFGDLEGRPLEIRLGLSTTSDAAAADNLNAEAPDFDFAAALQKSRAAWNGMLSRIDLSDRTDPLVRANFNSALYRVLLQPNLISDVGRPNRYSTFSLWDTFRAAHPLYTIIAPEYVPDFVNSLLDQYDRQGYLPIWSLGGGENHCMIGHHAVPVIVDAHLKGFEGVDWNRAYAAIKDSLTHDHRAAGEGTWGLTKEDWKTYDKYGYYPYDRLTCSYEGKPVLGESASRTLECAYDDACAAKLARALGKADDDAFFSKRAGNWRHLFDPSVGFVRGRDSRGRWRTPFDPKDCGAGPWAENDFTEGNAWQYTWHVMQDPDGLVDAFGGKVRFGERLQALFEEKSEVRGKSFLHDVTGLIGQYAHGNEPSHHVAYLFRWSDRPSKTAEYVRKIAETQYAPRPDGLCGNDDCGQMAAWYIFSVLGFYPLDPCGGEYVIGVPLTPQATIRLRQGGCFSVRARDLSASRRFSSAVPRTISHKKLMSGGFLDFAM